MMDLFGNSQPTRKKLPEKNVKTERQSKQKHHLEKAADVPLHLLRRPVRGGRVEKAWNEFNWQPQKGKLTHFNAGIGYNILTQRRYPFYGCFGHILDVNDATGEVLVHIPQPIMTRGADEYFIVPFWDLLPPQVVSDFDIAAFAAIRPSIPCPRLAIWNVNPYQ